MPNTDFTPRVITGESVDLISPFPPTYLKRLGKWTHEYKSMLTWDYGPQTEEEIASMLEECIATKPSFGVVDKYNKIGVKSDGPVVVGSFVIDYASPVNCYIHTVSQRRAWGKGLMDEGVDLLLADLFSNPALLRVSANMISSNRSIISMALRHGFKREGLVRDMIVVKGEPRSVAFYGLTRQDYNNLQPPVATEIEG